MNISRRQNAIVSNSVMAALKAAKDFLFVIGLKRQAIVADGESKTSGKGIQPNHYFEGLRSTMFDSVFVLAARI